jgi:hypothetical protein
MTWIAFNEIVIASEAKQSKAEQKKVWTASSLALLAMATMRLSP